MTSIILKQAFLPACVWRKINSKTMSLLLQRMCISHFKNVLRNI